jgi:hypothetical protein
MGCSRPQRAGSLLSTNIAGCRAWGGDNEALLEGLMKMWNAWMRYMTDEVNGLVITRSGVNIILPASHICALPMILPFICFVPYEYNLKALGLLPKE